MKQSRTMSLAEALANVAVGYWVAVTTQMMVFPLFELATSLGENMAIGAVFTVVSIVRSFTLRRAFEALRVRIGREPPRGGGAVGRYQSIR